MVPASASLASLKLVTAPAAELFAASDAVVLEALRIESDVADATYLGMVLAAARLLFEEQTGLALITQTWQAAWDRIPSRPRDGVPHRRLSLGRAPLIALSSCTYLDEDGASQSFTLSGNLVAANVGVRHSFGLVALEEDADWPDLGDYPEALKIQFTAGYGATAASVPEAARLAVLQLASWWYQSRLPVAVGNIANELPLHCQRLLSAYRIDS